MTWPSAIGARSTSIGAPAAMVEASGFIWAMSGTSAAAAPIVATAPVAIYRKSRRVGSAEDIVVTYPFLSVRQSARSPACEGCVNCVQAIVIPRHHGGQPPGGG